MSYLCLQKRSTQRRQFFAVDKKNYFTERGINRGRWRNSDQCQQNAAQQDPETSAAIQKIGLILNHGKIDKMIEENERDRFQCV